MNIPTLSSRGLTGERAATNALQNEAETDVSFAPLLDEYFQSESVADGKSRILQHETFSQSAPPPLTPAPELSELSLEMLSTGENSVLSLLTSARGQSQQLAEAPLDGEHRLNNDEANQTIDEEQTSWQHNNNADATLLHGLFALLPAAISQPPNSAFNASQKELLSLTKDAATLSTSLDAASERSLKLAMNDSSFSEAAITEERATTPAIKALATNAATDSIDTNHPVANNIATQNSVLSNAGTNNSDTDASLPVPNNLTSSSQTLSPSLPAASPLVNTPNTTQVNTPSAPTLSAQLGSPEWQQALSQQIIMIHGQGKQRSELHLHPQELGALHITLKLDDNQAQLHIASAQGVVRSAVEAALPHLRQALAEQGINLGQSSVGSEPSPSSQSQHHNSSSYREQHGRTEEDVEVGSVSTTVQTSRLSANGIDTFA